MIFWSENVPPGKCIAKVSPIQTVLMVDEKWVSVNMQNYTGNDGHVSVSTLFAHPSECHKFLANGQLTVAEFIRHHNTLAYAGLWKWTDPQFENALQNTVGPKYFKLMAKLDMKKLNELVSSSLKQKVQFLDYPTECRLKKLLEKEKDYGPDGRTAREELNNHREFYNEWGRLLFGGSAMKEQEEEIATPAAVTANPTAAATATTVASIAAERLHGVLWIVIGSLLYLLN
jgi:hypothetical protein